MRLVMMGTGLFAEPTFEALLHSPHDVVGLVTQPDRAIGSERGSTRQTGRGMKTIALEHDLPVLQPEKINTPAGVAALTALKPDMLVVAAYGQILSREVLAVPPLGGVNVHASLLPKYRGAAPVAWAIYHGETTTGVTIIKMTTGLDAGDMLAQETINITPEETAGELEARLAPLGAKLALAVVDQMAAGTGNGVKQDMAQVTKAPKLKKEDGLIEWNRSAQQIRDQIRAMQPWPTAYTFVHREGKPPLRVIICRTGEVRGVLGLGREGKSLPGFIVLPNPRGSGTLQVKTGNPGILLEITELQPAGKKPMTGVEFLRGHPFQPGDHFGAEQS
jgi:methionyl-tRNA formyltransferase